MDIRLVKSLKPVRINVHSTRFFQRVITQNQTDIMESRKAAVLCIAVLVLQLALADAALVSTEMTEKEFSLLRSKRGDIDFWCTIGCGAYWTCVAGNKGNASKCGSQPSGCQCNGFAWQGGK